MDRDPGEGTSDGRIKRNRKPRRKLNPNAQELIIKEEIKEEPIELSELHKYSRQSRSSVINAINVIQSDSENDDETDSDSDIDYVKEEIKIECEDKENEEEKSKKESREEENEQTNDIDVGNSDDGNRDVPVTGQNSNGEERRINLKAKGRNRVLTKKRDMANAAKKPRTDQKKLHKCQQCNYSTSFKTDLTQHIRTHTGEKPFECEICEKAFAVKNNLNRHKRIHRSQFAFHCSKCQRGFAKENDKIKHESKCNVREYKCYMCKYYTLHLPILKCHMRYKHTGEKGFECLVCSMKFTTKTGLNRHSRVHSKELPFDCLKCGRRFANRNEKQSHEERCKGHQFECYVCCKYKSFSSGNLKRHMRSIHTGDKPFRCSVCKKKFAHKGHLKKHLKTHSIQRGIHCSKCLRRVTDEDAKLAHENGCKLRHYGCYLCKFKVQRKGKLNWHMQKQHIG